MTTAIEMRALKLNLQLSKEDEEEIIRKKHKASKLIDNMNTKNQYELIAILDNISQNVFYGQLELDELPDKPIIKSLKSLGFTIKKPKSHLDYTSICW